MSSHNVPATPPPPSDADRVAELEAGLAEIDAAMLRFAHTGDAADLVDRIADVLTEVAR